jgi:hypothetical protein
VLPALLQDVIQSLGHCCSLTTHSGACVSAERRPPKRAALRRAPDRGAAARGARAGRVSSGGRARRRGAPPPAPSVRGPSGGVARRAAPARGPRAQPAHLVSAAGCVRLRSVSKEGWPAERRLSPDQRRQASDAASEASDS